jgi:hypothetical protein
MDKIDWVNILLLVVALGLAYLLIAQKVNIWPFKKSEGFGIGIPDNNQQAGTTVNIQRDPNIDPNTGIRYQNSQMGTGQIDQQSKINLEGMVISGPVMGTGQMGDGSNYQMPVNVGSPDFPVPTIGTGQMGDGSNYQMPVNVGSPDIQVPKISYYDKKTGKNYIDPNTGQPYILDIGTGMPFDPNTGQFYQINPSTGMPYFHGQSGGSGNGQMGNGQMGTGQMDNGQVGVPIDIRRDPNVDPKTGKKWNCGNQILKMDPKTKKVGCFPNNILTRRYPKPW